MPAEPPEGDEVGSGKMPVTSLTKRDRQALASLLAIRLRLMKGDQGTSQMAKRDQVLEAVRAIGRPCSVPEIRKWLENHHNGTVWSDVANNLSALTVNDANRHHHSSRTDFKPDPAHPLDVLIRVSVRGGRDVRYWLYDHVEGGPAPFATDAGYGPPGATARARLNLGARYWQVWEAVQALNRPSSIREITEWLEQRYPGIDHPDVRSNASMLTVNDANRPHLDAGRKSYRSDLGHPKDVLYRRGDATIGVTYERYDALQHGVWDLYPGADGKWKAVKLDLGPVDQALAVARADVHADSPHIFENESEARRFQMRAIVLREGQVQFKAALMDAYGGRCAITGCQVHAILEAAHIVPYSQKGVLSNVIPNGLLLRTDIHTLFDRGLLWIDAEYFIQVKPELDNSEYAPLRGRKLSLPSAPDLRPHQAHLTHHRIHTAQRPD